MNKYFNLPSPIPAALFSLNIRFLKRWEAIRFAIFKNHSVGDWEWPDWFSTPHNKGFFDTAEFQSAYSKSVEVAGFDYRIPWRVHQALWAAQSTTNLDGDIVEVGTGRGFIMAAVADWMSGAPTPQTKGVWLCDTFEPPDSEDSKKLSFSKYYATGPKDVIESFAPWPFVRFVVGNVYQTLPSQAPDKVSFLHLDLNDADAEVWVLGALWPRLVPGAIIILDDYANRGLEDQYRAVNTFLEGVGKTALTTAAGQGIVIR